jgi:hypothetical protein
VQASSTDIGPQEAVYEQYQGFRMQSSFIISLRQELSDWHNLLSSVFASLQDLPHTSLSETNPHQHHQRQPNEFYQII